jgi:hypothetical protein
MIVVLIVAAEEDVTEKGMVTIEIMVETTMKDHHIVEIGMVDVEENLEINETIQTVTTTTKNDLMTCFTYARHL